MSAGRHEAVCRNVRTRFAPKERVMRLSAVLSGLTVGAVTLALLPITAQQPANPMSLTADDLMQIQQLVMRSSHAVHTGANDGMMQWIHLRGPVHSRRYVQRQQGARRARGAAAWSTAWTAERSQLRVDCDHPANAGRGDWHPIRAGHRFRAGRSRRRPRSPRVLRGRLCADTARLPVRVATLRERVAGCVQGGTRANEILARS
jgi:hypothetical protein